MNEGKTHYLKTFPYYFEKVGRRRFDIRKNDRDFQLTDRVILQEYTGGSYTGREIDIGKIDYILRDHECMGLEKGYIIFCTDSLPEPEKIVAN